MIPTLNLPNQYDEDLVLQSIMRRLLPSSSYKSIEPDLYDLGEKSATIYLELAKEQELSPPRFQKFDAFGRKINKLWTCSAWKQQHGIAAKEGVVGLGYQCNAFSEGMASKHWRIYQFCKLLLWAPSSGLCSCPIAMTDGAAKLISMITRKSGNEYLKDDVSSEHMALLKEAFSRLTSLDADTFWTSGQWMTERGGGSDVAQNGTKTIAKQQRADGNKDEFRLFGYKWFSSATDCDVSIALARTEGVDEEGVLSGIEGVSCFYVPDVAKQSELNLIETVQLKHKLGTKQLPTAELQLNGAKGLHFDILMF